MKNNVTSLLVIGAIIGFTLCLFMKTIPSCSNENQNPIARIDTIYWKPDTIRIPVPKIEYRTIAKKEVEIWKEYLTLIDSFIRKDTLWKKDSLSLPVNVYKDSIQNDSIDFKWSAETLGFLLSFNPEFRIKRKIDPCPDYREKKWTVGLGLSDRVNSKVSIGYKGWMTEIEFNPKLRFNQLYITKQWTF